MQYDRIFILYLVLILLAGLSASEYSDRLTTEETHQFTLNGENHNIELNFVDGGADITLDNARSEYTRPLNRDSYGYGLYDGDKFTANGVTIDFNYVNYSTNDDQGIISYTAYEEKQVKNITEGQERQFHLGNRTNVLALKYVDGGAAIKLNDEETLLGSELQQGDKFYYGSIGIEAVGVGYDDNKGYMEYRTFLTESEAPKGPESGLGDVTAQCEVGGATQGNRAQYSIDVPDYSNYRDLDAFTVVMEDGKEYQLSERGLGTLSEGSNKFTDELTIPTPIASGEHRVFLELRNDVGDGNMVIDCGTIGQEKSNQQIPVDRGNNTYSWNDRITVSEDTELKPIYFGKGLRAMNIRDGGITLQDIENKEELRLEDTGSRTVKQDYVVHLCDSDGKEADLILTPGSEDTDQICGGNTIGPTPDPTNPIKDVELNIESQADQYQFSTTYESTYDIESIEWDLNGDNQYEEEGSYVNKNYDKGVERDVKLKLTDVNGNTEKVKKSISVEGTETVSIELEKDKIDLGNKIEFGINVGQEQSSQGYKVVIEDEGDDVVWEEPGQSSSKSYSIGTSEEDWRAGKYNIKIVPQRGLLGSVIDIITGSEAYASKKFEIQRPLARWKEYCTNNNYDINTVDGQLDCIREDVKGKWFEDTVSEGTDVPDSLCKDLLDYQYSPDQNRCIAGE